MKAIFFTSLLALSLASPMAAFAETKVQHYQPARVSTKAEAISVFELRMSEIDKLLSKEKPTATDLERVHQLSYDLEAAVEAFGKFGVDVKAVGLDQKVEELHLASETHNATTTKSAYVKVAKAYQECGE